MFYLHGRNAHAIFPNGMTLLEAHGTPEESRNGPVKALPFPLTVHYQQPTERVLFDPARDANPFFHLWEALWMLGGQQDVTRLAWLVPRMREYSDNSVHFHGAYGHRWRHHWAGDQLEALIRLLHTEPTTRRAVLTMWDPAHDLLPTYTSKDLPCNTQAFFRITEGRLHLTVVNRSNDLLWGLFGANVVHFSFLQEYMAARLGLAVGWYEQITNNGHVYLTAWQQYAQACAADGRSYGVPTPNPYTLPDPMERVKTFPLDARSATWDRKLKTLLDLWHGRSLHLYIPPPEATDFLDSIAVPMYRAYWHYREDQIAAGVGILVEAQEALPAGRQPNDWLTAGIQWLSRRLTRRTDTDLQAVRDAKETNR